MSITVIGENIARLRKLKEVKQDALAKFVGVSPQAVSKWENGGIPDTELLPKIADFFDVTIDELFGRQNIPTVEIKDVILDDILKTRSEDRIARAFELCWMIEQSLYGRILSDQERLREESLLHNEDDQIYSQVLMDTGYTEMGLFNRMRYFLVVPEASDKDKALLDGVDYPAFFALLSDKDLFNTLVFLHKRESLNSFTEKLLMKELNLTAEKVKEIITKLLQLDVLGRMVAEEDEGIVEFYQFAPRPSFASMLIFAREMIDVPDNFYIYRGKRKKPYLK